MNRKTLLAFLISMLIFFYSRSQESECRYMAPMNPFNIEQWGIGVCHVSNKSQRIPFYSTSFKSHGCFEQRSNNDMFMITFDRDDQGVIRGKGINAIYIGSNLRLLPIREHPTNNELINISWLGSIGNYYINKADLVDIGAVVLSYKQILTSDDLPKEILDQKKKKWLGVNLKKDCLNLRTSPSINSGILDCIPSNDWNYSLVNRITILDNLDDWAKIEVIFMTFKFNDKLEDPCQQYQDYKRLTGWVKMIDSTGFPNIWYAF